MGLISQETALSNAAEASAKLRQRRREREEVDEYLRALHAQTVADTDDWFTTIENADRPLLWGLPGADQVLGYAVQLHVAALRDAAENREGLIGR